MGYARPMSWNRSLAGFAAVNGAMAVAVGAFAAHGAGPQVKTLLTTGAGYQLSHALLGLVCALWPAAPRLARVGGWMAAGGGLIFCLALALIGLASLPVLGAVAPVGGILMIGGWLAVALSAVRPFSAHA